MNKSSILAIILVCLSGLAACKSDEPEIPANALSLNMLNSDNGRTTISGTDVFINEANNFCSRQFVITDLGSKGGFSSRPNLAQLSQEVAVIPGHYYQIFEDRRVDYIAGSNAFPISQTFYNVYADSWLYDKDNNITGVLIKFAGTKPSAEGLPDPGTEYILYMHDNFDNVERAKYSFPKNFYIDSSYNLNPDNAFEGRLEIGILDNTITFANRAYAPASRAKVTVNVRNGYTFSSVSFIVSNEKSEW